MLKAGNQLKLIKKWLLGISLLSAQLCWGQGTEVPGSLTPQGIDTSLAAARQLGESIQKSKAEILQQERNVSLEVKRGITRVTKACEQRASNGPLTKLEKPPTSPTNYLLAKQGSVAKKQKTPSLAPKRLGPRTAKARAFLTTEASCAKQRWLLSTTRKKLIRLKSSTSTRLKIDTSTTMKQ